MSIDPESPTSAEQPIQSEGAETEQEATCTAAEETAVDTTGTTSEESPVETTADATNSSTEKPIDSKPIEADPVETQLQKLTEQVHSLQSCVEALSVAITNCVENAKNRQIIIDRQHQELEEYRRNGAEKLKLELVSDIISEIDGRDRNIEYYSDQEPTETNYKRLLKRASSHVDDLVDLLMRHDIYEYDTTMGDHFDPKRQTVHKVTETADETKDKVIESVIHRGFEQDGKIIRKARVNVYRYVPAKANDETANTEAGTDTQD